MCRRLNCLRVGFSCVRNYVWNETAEFVILRSFVWIRRIGNSRFLDADT